jgi:hypothetical protein
VDRGWLWMLGPCRAPGLGPGLRRGLVSLCVSGVEWDCGLRVRAVYSGSLERTSSTRGADTAVKEHAARAALLESESGLPESSREGKNRSPTANGARDKPCR